MCIVDDDWSLASEIQEDWEDVRSVASIAATDLDPDFDVRSIASSGAGSTAMAGDHLAYDTAHTVGGCLPLAAVPARRFLSVREGGFADDDSASQVSLSTRRGWPRISPTAVRQSSGVAPAGSYRDALLRGPLTAEEVAEQQAALAAEREASRERSADEQRRGWVMLSQGSRLQRMRSARVTITRLATLAEEPSAASGVVAPGA